MSNIISGNMAGCYSPMGKTFVLVDESGNELTGVVVDQEQLFTADDSKVAAGYIYAGDDGVSTGSREFLSYRTTKIRSLVLPGESFTILLDEYDKWDYTYLQCIIAKFNTTIDDSVYTEKVVIENNVYPVNSTDILATVSRNESTKSIDLNIINDTEDTYIIYCTTYKEEEL